MTKSLQEFNKEKLEEFDKEFYKIGYLITPDILVKFGDSTLAGNIKHFLSTALAEQAKMIEAAVVPKEGTSYNRNICRQEVLDKFKELNK